MTHYLERKRLAQSFGLKSETFACWYLRLKGYRILARNKRTPVGEIDIIVQKRRMLCFIEVKARKEITDSLHALGRSQQNRILSAAQSFISQNPRYSDFQIRFDLIALAPKRWPVHIRNAWWKEE